MKKRKDDELLPQNTESRELWLDAESSTDGRNETSDEVKHSEEEDEAEE